MLLSCQLDIMLHVECNETCLVFSILFGQIVKSHLDYQLSHNRTNSYAFVYHNFARSLIYLIRQDTKQFIVGILEELA